MDSVPWRTEVSCPVREEKVIGTYKHMLVCQQTTCPPGYTSASQFHPASSLPYRSTQPCYHMLWFCSGVHSDRYQYWEEPHSLCIYMLVPCLTTLRQVHMTVPTNIKDCLLDSHVFWYIIQNPAWESSERWGSLVRFEVLKARCMKMDVFWNVALWSGRYQQTF